jgi:predicted CopG family antitoxin
MKNSKNKYSQLASFSIDAEVREILNQLKRNKRNISDFIRDAIKEKKALEESTNEKDTQNIQEI